MFVGLLDIENMDIAVDIAVLLSVQAEMLVFLEM